MSIKDKKVEFSFGYLIKEYPKHKSNLYEIHYTLRGAGTLLGNDFRYDLEPDILTISPPGEMHYIKVKEYLAFHVIKIKYYGSESELLDKVCEKCKELGGFKLPKSRRYEFERLKILSAISDSKAEQSTWYGLISILGELLISDIISENIYSDDILTDIVRYMDNNLQNKLKLDDIANFFNTTSVKINKIFKQRTGIPAMDYFQRLKIDAACYLLKSSEYLNKEIALHLAFSDEFHFSKCFKKKTGISPKEYRQKILENNS